MARPEEPTHCCFDEWATHAARRARTRETSAKITAALVAALEEAGLRGRTVLDVGCGSGDLALATVARGADSATGFDLGPGAIREARSLATERGLSERTHFVVGDGAEIALPRADVVSLNRVLCCYPHIDALLANTLEAAGSVYGFTAPHDRGAIGLANRVSVSASPQRRLLILAEGTRSSDGHTARFKGGSFLLAIEAGLPVVPIAVIGTRKVMPKNRLRTEPAEVMLVVHDPIPAPALERPTARDAKAFADRVHRIVSQTVESRQFGASYPAPRTSNPHPAPRTI